MTALAIRDREATAPAAQPIWDALVAADKPLSVTDLLCRTDANRGAAENRLRNWAKAGVIIRIPGHPIRYSMPPGRQAPVPPSITANGAAPRKVPTRERLWLAMRVLKRFDFPALQIAAEADHGTARAYIVQLVRAGYLRCLKQGNGRTGEQAQYLLCRNTGRTAPRPVTRTVLRTQTVTLHDGNTGEAHDVTPPRRKQGRL